MGHTRSNRNIKIRFIVLHLFCIAYNTPEQTTKVEGQQTTSLTYRIPNARRAQQHIQPDPEHDPAKPSLLSCLPDYNKATYLFIIQNKASTHIYFQLSIFQYFHCEVYQIKASFTDNSQ